VAGAGINIAQRVMDCGDAGHILVSNVSPTISSKIVFGSPCFTNWAKSK